MPSDHDALLLAAADALAAWLHRDDTDKQGEPLIGHCRRVAATLRAEGWPAEVQAAGLLHDSVEMARTVANHLNVFFRCGSNHRVASLVAHVTRSEDPYEQYIEWVRCAGGAARAIKLADLRDNLDSSRPIPESLRRRYERAVEVLTSEQAAEEG